MPADRVHSRKDRGRAGKAATPNSAKTPPADLKNSQNLYHNLAEDEIRVLRLFRGGNQDVLYGSLEHAKLSSHQVGGIDKPICSTDFGAISYAWVSSDKPCSINTDAGAIPITASLDAALRHYRTSDGNRPLWADALCINQADLLEKNAQVAKMGDIYSASKEVLVWLGSSLNVARESHAIEVMTACVERAMTAYSGYDDESADDLSVETLLPYIGSEKVGDSGTSGREYVLAGLFAVAEICQRSWFSRLWVVQETQDQFDKITFSIGELDFSSEQLIWGLDALMDNCFAFKHEQVPSSTHDDESFYRGIADHLRLRETDDDPLEAVVFSRILRFSGRKCLDARDRVFALRKVLSLGRFDDLHPDYTIDPGELFRGLVHRLVVCDGDTNGPNQLVDRVLMLAVIGTEVSPMASSSRPSWTPDLHNLSDFSRGKRNLYDMTCLIKGRALQLIQEHRVLLEESQPHWDAFCGQFHCRDVPDEPMRIQVRGRWFGTATQRVSLPTWSELSTTDVGEALEDYFTQCCQIISSSIGLARRAHDTDIIRFLGYPTFWTEGPSEQGSLSPEDVRMQHYRDCGLCREVDESLWWPCWVMHTVRKTQNDGQLQLWRIRTASGYDIAWLPATSRTGDRIHIFAGGPWPFVLRRKQDDVYQLLGDGHTFSTPLVEALGFSSPAGSKDVACGQPLGFNMLGLQIDDLMGRMRWITLA